MSPPRPMCFVAMPFGRRKLDDDKGLELNFDRVYDSIRAAVQGEGFECIRADFDPAGGFIHRSMFERLLVAEYVIADLSLGNVNVAYELGLRHGASVGTTFLLCERRFVGALPFDLRPLRFLTYPLDDSGELSTQEAADLEGALGERIRQARNGKLPPDNPILQVTTLRPAAVGHEKTDVFLERMEYVSDVTQRIAEALRLPIEQGRLKRLDDIANELLSTPDTVPQLHTALLAVYLSYRESKAYPRMLDLYHQLPRELRETPVAREQLALALNRMAEQKENEGDRQSAKQFRDRALAAAELPEHQRTSETYGILGRIYKGLATAEQNAGRERQRLAALGRAIELYETGFRADPRDYYPGVNAVTLRLMRNSPEDSAVAGRLATVVRFSVERAPAPGNEEERFWRSATRLELACAERDWTSANEAIQSLLAIRAQPWMRETTAANLKLYRNAYASDPDAARELTHFIETLESDP